MNAGKHAETEVSVQSILKLFRIIFKSTTQHSHDVEQKLGIGGASLWALAEVAVAESLTVSGLAQTMSIHQSTASNLIEKLESRGYLVRQRSESDRRIVHLTLTSKGRETLAQAPPPYRGILPDAVMKLSPETLNQLYDNLSELVSKLESKREEDAYNPIGKL